MARLDTANRRMAGRQPRSVADRPSALRLLLMRQRRLARTLGLIGIGGVALVVLAMALRSAEPSESLNSFQERWGRLVGIKVQQVVVEGRQNTPEPLLMAALGVSAGRTDMFGFSVEDARARIEKLSWVGSVSVERRLPGLVVVDLHEKRPFAIWQHNGQFHLIDRDGAVVTNEDLAGFADLPVVVGEGAPNHAQGLLDEVARYPALQHHTVAAVRVGDRRWNLRLTNGADLLLPEGAEAAALKRLMELQSTDSLLDRHLTVIDMRLPDRLVIRPAPDSPPQPDQAKHPAS